MNFSSTPIPPIPSARIPVLVRKAETTVRTGDSGMGATPMGAQQGRLGRPYVVEVATKKSKQ
jgi:hypothetical protein